MTLSSDHLTPRQQATRAAGKRMRQLMIDFRAVLDEELKQHGVTTAQLRPLVEVRERPGSTGAQIARAANITPQSAQALLARAVAHGWMVRGKHPESERLVTFHLTPAGETLLSEVETIVPAIEARAWHGVTETEMESVTAIVSRVLANLSGKSLQ